MYSDQSWGNISVEAKDLLRNILKKDPFARFDVHQLLDHPWIANGGPGNKLKTPLNLKQVNIEELEDLVCKAFVAQQVIDKETFMTRERESKENQMNRPGSLLQRRR